MAATETELEAFILQEPSLPEGWLVYADWLADRGDRRGLRLAALGRGEVQVHVSSGPARGALLRLLLACPCAVLLESLSLGRLAAGHTPLSRLVIVEYDDDPCTFSLQPELCSRTFREEEPRIDALLVRAPDLVVEVFELLLASPFLDGLRVLDLAGGELTDRHGRIVLERPGDFWHLQVLDLRDNSLQDLDLIDEIGFALPRARLDEQHGFYFRHSWR
jgi:uncharacterized protein (TIGR02996 family)